MAEESVSIKQINLDRIRAFMDQEGSVSKSQISRRLGLSFPTVTRLVDELCSAGELLEQGTGTSTGGRCACFYPDRGRTGMLECQGHEGRDS